MGRIFLIFSGYNNRAVITLLRKLESRQIDFVLVAAGDHDDIFRTPYSARAYVIRRDLTLTLNNIKEVLLAVHQRLPGHEFIYAPTTEALNRFMLQYRVEFERLGLVIPLVEEFLYKRLSDKFEFAHCCREYGIAVPEEYTDLNICPLPFVAKHKNYNLSGAGKPIFVCSEAERQEFIKNGSAGQFYFQKFLTGRSYYLLVHRSRSGEINVLSQENLIQQPNGGSIIAARVSDYHLSREAQDYLHMLAAMGFYGLIMIEVRRQDGCGFMIEANPRLWGPSQLYVDAMEMDLLDSFLSDWGYDTARYVPKHKGSLYFWYSGYLETLASGEQPTYYNYSPAQLASELHDFLDSDIYNRRDTSDLFDKTVRRMC